MVWCVSTDRELLATSRIVTLRYIDANLQLYELVLRTGSWQYAISRVSPADKKLVICYSGCSRGQETDNYHGGCKILAVWGYVGHNREMFTDEAVALSLKNKFTTASPAVTYRDHTWLKVSLIGYELLKRQW